MNLLDTLKEFSELPPDTSGAPYVLGKEHIEAFQKALEEIKAAFKAGWVFGQQDLAETIDCNVNEYREASWQEWLIEKEIIRD